MMSILFPIKSKVRRFFFNVSLYFHLRKSDKIKIVVGASNTAFKGWLSTDKDILDITKEKDWNLYFQKNSLDNILAEHVFEHLSKTEAKRAFKNIFKYLKKGGVFRFAVPDSYHPSLYLRSLVGVGGSERGVEDHKISFNIDNLHNFVANLDFDIVPIEYFDNSGIFHSNYFTLENGYIKRCSLYNKGRFNNPEEYSRLIDTVPENLRFQFKNMRYPSTSLFVDFIKI